MHFFKKIQHYFVKQHYLNNFSSQDTANIYNALIAISDKEEMKNFLCSHSYPIKKLDELIIHAIDKDNLPIIDVCYDLLTEQKKELYIKKYKRVDCFSYAKHALLNNNTKIFDYFISLYSNKHGSGSYLIQRNESIFVDLIEELVKEKKIEYINILLENHMFSISHYLRDYLFGALARPVNKNTDRIEFFLSNKEKFNNKNNPVNINLNNLLLYACSNYAVKTETLETLIQFGADVTAFKCSALLKEGIKRKPEMIEYLVEKGIKHSRHFNKIACLYTGWTDLKTIQYFVNCGADIKDISPEAKEDVKNWLNSYNGAKYLNNSLDKALEVKKEPSNTSLRKI